jgi:hypothetical protein
MSQGDTSSSSSSGSGSSSSAGSGSSSSSSSNNGSNVTVEGKVGARLLYEGASTPREIDVVFSLRNPGGAWLIESVAIVRDSLTDKRRSRSSSSE